MGVWDENEKGGSGTGGCAIINKQTHRYAIGRRVWDLHWGEGDFCFSLRLSPIRNASVRASPATFDRCVSVAFYFTFFLGSGSTRTSPRVETFSGAVLRSESFVASRKNKGELRAKGEVGLSSFYSFCTYV